jgi:hypothetical protein
MKGNTMKKTVILGLALIIAMSSLGLAQVPKTLPEAESLAITQGKLVLADFSTVW